MEHLFVAHPGHELLLHGWISRTRPVVHVLTDGSGHASASRLAPTVDLLRDLGATRGAIFGRLSDREAYAMLLERNSALLFSIVAELAADLARDRPAIVATDAAEGYNPVHDLCRMIAGAAVAMAGIDVKQREYPVVFHPNPPDAESVIELDEAEFARKIARARQHRAILGDVDELLARYGEDAYRREAFCRITDWTALDETSTPEYERHGEQRTAAHRYTHVIRQREHMVPLRDALRDAVEKRSCAF